MLPCLPYDPSRADSLPFMLRAAMKAASVGENRRLAFVSMDASPYWGAYVITQLDKAFANLVMLPAYGHWSWSDRLAFLSIVQPLFGEVLLSEHAGRNASVAMQMMIMNNGDKHKTADWLDLLVEVLEEELAFHFLKEQGTVSSQII